MTTSSTTYPESEYFTMAALFMFFTILDIPPPPEPPVPTLYPSPLFPPVTPPPPPPTSTFSPLPPFPWLPPFTLSTTWSPPRPSQPELKWLRLVAMYVLTPITVLVVIFLIAKCI
nr:hypothetical protein CFP56_42735 [Quercus suber]